MVSILDIAPPDVITETINIRDKWHLPVQGISAKNFAILLRRFPVLAKQASGMDIPPDEALLANIETIPAIIAAGLGHIGNKDIEKGVDERLTDDEKKRVVEAIMRLTRPETTEDPLESQAPTLPLIESKHNGAARATK